MYQIIFRFASPASAAWGSNFNQKYSFDDYGNLNWQNTNNQMVEFTIKYIDENGNDISINEYNLRKHFNIQVYICAFVGVTYHCG